MTKRANCSHNETEDLQIFASIINSILVYSLYYFIKEWESVKEIGETLNFSKSSIINCCNGKRKTAYNYKWKYKNENIS